MQTNIAITMPGGELQIMMMPGKPTDAQIEQEVKHAFKGKRVKSWRILPPEHDRADRRYRGAWRDHGGPLELDMPYARKLRLQQLRRARAQRFVELDRDLSVQIAQGETDKARRTEEKRQALRDMPVTILPRLDAATDADALDAVQLDAAFVQFSGQS